METFSMLLIMCLQIILSTLGAVALYGVLRNRTHSMDLVTVGIGLVAATQLNITFARIRHGASITNYNDVPDWVASNLVGAACLIFLLVVLTKTRRRIK